MSSGKPLASKKQIVAWATMHGWVQPDTSRCVLTKDGDTLDMNSGAWDRVHECAALATLSIHHNITSEVIRAEAIEQQYFPVGYLTTTDVEVVASDLLEHSVSPSKEDMLRIAASFYYSLVDSDFYWDALAAAVEERYG